MFRYLDVYIYILHCIVDCLGHAMSIRHTGSRRLTEHHVHANHRPPEVHHSKDGVAERGPGHSTSKSSAPSHTTTGACQVSLKYNRVVATCRYRHIKAPRELTAPKHCIRSVCKREGRRGHTAQEGTPPRHTMS